MIYIFRHQRGTFGTNCLSAQGVADVKRMAKAVRTLGLDTDVHTSLPTGYKHMRPVQTACTLCTFLNNQSSVIVHENHTTLSQELCLGKNTLVVWHHGDICNLIAAITGVQPKFEWPDDNYGGCVRIDPSANVCLFNPRFF